ncbi:MAG: hypothetical protein ABFS42_09545 [Candidatus Krumholzibacteriota bacterium]
MMGRLVPRSLRLELLVAVLLVSWHQPTAVQGEGLRDFSGGWLLPISDRAHVLAPAGAEPSAPGNDRPARPGTTGWGWWLGAGQGQLYSLQDLPLKSVDCGWLHRSEIWPLSVAFSWERLGESLYLEDTKMLRIRAGERVWVAARIRFRRWLVAKVPAGSAWEAAFQGGFSVRMGKSARAKIGLWLHATDIPGWHGRGGRRTLADLRVFYSGTGLAVRVDQKGNGAPVPSLEILGRLTPYLGLGWLVDPDTGSMGGNLSARVGGLWLQTSHLVHPALGVTHRFVLGVGDPGAASW